MTENKPGPARVVEEPAGYDRSPTERIPVPGDLSAERTRPEPPRMRDEDDRPEPVAAAPALDAPESVTGSTESVTDPVGPWAGSVEPTPAPATSAGRPAETGLFDEGAVRRFRDRWRDLQAGFVDDPAQAVRGADELIDEIMRELAEHRQQLEEQWRGGPDDTEELRVVIREYRAFFNQLLNA